ncbi:MAG: DUF1292 domain-containing protein [Bacillota bacterium]
MIEENIILTDDEGNELECEYLDTINYQGKDYAILYPLDQDEDEGAVLIMEVVATDDEEELLPVEDEDLLDAIFAEFMRIAELEE